MKSPITFDACAQKVNPPRTLTFSELTKSLDTLKVLLDQKLYYVESVDTVDTVYSENHVPSLKQYLSRRERTAGVYPVIATIPWVKRR